MPVAEGAGVSVKAQLAHRGEGDGRCVTGLAVLAELNPFMIFGVLLLLHYHDLVSHHSSAIHLSNPTYKLKRSGKSSCWSSVNFLAAVIAIERSIWCAGTIGIQRY